MTWVIVSVAVFAFTVGWLCGRLHLAGDMQEWALRRQREILAEFDQ